MELLVKNVSSINDTLCSSPYSRRKVTRSKYTSRDSNAQSLVKSGYQNYNNFTDVSPFVGVKLSHAKASNRIFFGTTPGLLASKHLGQSGSTICLLVIC